MLLQIPKVMFSHSRLHLIFLFFVNQYLQLIQKCSHFKHENECKKSDVKKKKKCKSIIVINKRSIPGYTISNSSYALSISNIFKKPSLLKPSLLYHVWRNLTSLSLLANPPAYKFYDL